MGGGVKLRKGRRDKKERSEKKRPRRGTKKRVFFSFPLILMRDDRRDKNRSKDDKKQKGRETRTRKRGRDGYGNA